jgi:hypothetical protein
VIIEGPARSTLNIDQKTDVAIGGVVVSKALHASFQFAKWLSCQ